jgi:hypothetical protein
MPEMPLFFVHTYTDRDRAFWEEHLAAWVPERVVDAHVHISHPRYQIETLSEELKRSYWVMELSEPQDAATAARCYRLLYPGREVSCLCFPSPSLGTEVEGANLDTSREARRRGWRSLAVTRPTWVAEQLAWWLDQPSVLGVKPYYSMLGYDRTQRDTYLEASIFDFLPHHQLEVLNDRCAWVTLHVPKAERLGHPDNQRELRELRRRYPKIVLVIAHLGRSYALPHAEAGLLPLADDPGIHFDISAVMNPQVLVLALRHLGAERLLYGTDNPVFYMRGRQSWEGARYINHTSYPFAFNTQREAPETEAGYTLYTYEGLLALKQACADVGVDAAGVRKIMVGNAERLMRASNGKGLPA